METAILVTVLIIAVGAAGFLLGILLRDRQYRDENREAARSLHKEITRKLEKYQYDTQATWIESERIN